MASSRTGLARLTLPPPHRLGQSSSNSSFKVFRSSTTDAVGVDETDYHMPPAKKQKTQTLETEETDYFVKREKSMIVQTYDDQPLKDFSLFLPPKLPASIFQSESGLQEFAIVIAKTYIRIWKLSPQMTRVDIRLPVLYDDRLSGNEGFQKRFIDAIFQELSKSVKSIESLSVPRIKLTPTTNFSSIFHGFTGRTKIVQLFLPMTTSLNEKDLDKCNIKGLASHLHKIKLKEIVIVSTNPCVGKFCLKLKKELLCIKRCHLTVIYCDEEVLGSPGPKYASEEEGSSGKVLDAKLLVQSMNAYPGKEEKVNIGGRVFKEKESHQKLKTKVAFSTDCTYFDEAELSNDGPFPSKIWNLERLHQDGIDGSGVTIALIDSGINYIHPAFKNKILAVRNFVPDAIDDFDCVIDSDGHGTHCAGIAAGNPFYCPTSSDPKSESVLVPSGVAPGAKLVICKVVKTKNGEVDSDAFVRALHWLKELHTTGKVLIDVISVSLASTFYSNRRAQVISQLSSLGVITVCCASNVGRLRLHPIAFPARLGQVLCIGAHDENGKPTSFSPVGRELDYLAPGDSLWGPGPGTDGPFAMDCASGTSCATPGVAGLVCLILQSVKRICDKDPQKFQIGGKSLLELVHNVWVMREILKETSSSPGHHSDEIGHGTLNPYRLLDRSDEEIMRVINEIVEDE